MMKHRNRKNKRKERKQNLQFLSKKLQEEISFIESQTGFYQCPAKVKKNKFRRKSKEI